MAKKVFTEYSEVLNAIGQGRDIQYMNDGEWLDIPAPDALRCVAGNTVAPRHFRAKPDTIRIGDAEVPAPLREAPEAGEGYFYFELDSGFFVWEGDDRDIALFKQGTTFRTAGELGDAMSAVLAVFAPKD